jgi:hypothetical protein
MRLFLRFVHKSIPRAYDSEKLPLSSIIKYVCAGACMRGVKNRICSDKNLTLETDYIYWNVAKCIVTYDVYTLKYVKQTQEANYSLVSMIYLFNIFPGKYFMTGNCVELRFSLRV